MGVDVILYAEVEASPERINKAQEFFIKHGIIGEPQYARNGHVLFEVERPYRWNGETLKPRVEVYTLARYYFPEPGGRGHWPQIHVGIRCLQACFPEAEVFYGSDSGDDEGYLVTEDLIAEKWADWYRDLKHWGVDPNVDGVWGRTPGANDFRGHRITRYKELYG